MCAFQRERDGICSGNRLQPLARWVQRRFVWMMGFEYEQILLAVKNDTEVDLDNIQGMDIF
jgi:hypothetical protein